MLNPHTSAAIAQVVFYVPILPAAIFNLVRTWNHGLRLASFPLVTFSLLRLAGGILMIIRNSDPTNLNLIIAATVLLNVGLIPLLMCLVGFVRVILKSSVDKNKRAYALLRVIRMTFFSAIILLVVGGGLSGSGKHVATARSLSKAAYVALTAEVCLITVELVHLYTQKHRIASGSFIYIKLTLLSIPFLTIRAAYGLLYAFTVDNPHTIWSPLIGSAVAFSLMCLLVEYVSALIFLSLGMHYYRNLGKEESKAVASFHLSLRKLHLLSDKNERA